MDSSEKLKDNSRADNTGLTDCYIIIHVKIILIIIIIIIIISEKKNEKKMNT